MVEFKEVLKDSDLLNNIITSIAFAIDDDLRGRNMRYNDIVLLIELEIDKLEITEYSTYQLLELVDKVLSVKVHEKT